MYILDPLKMMQKMLMENYALYRSGEITVNEYLIRIKPIDAEIQKLELATLPDTLVLKESFSLHSHRLKS